VHTAPGEGGVRDEATDDLASRLQVSRSVVIRPIAGELAVPGPSGYVLAIHRGGCAVTLQEVGPHVVDQEHAAKVPASSTLQEAVVRTENWLLHSAIHSDQGSRTGGIKRWLNRGGDPMFADLQVAGYYLTAMAWLASGAAYCPDHVHIANFHAVRVTDWVAASLAKRADCRKNAFDLSMAARGVAANLHRDSQFDRRQALLVALCERTGRASTMPDDWSPGPGPHHLKAAAAVLRLPDRVASSALTSMARETSEYWTHELWTKRWPSNELHAALCGLEGMLILAGSRDGQGLRLVERPFARLMEKTQAPDGTLPETIHGGTVRSDVLAQALRIGLLLRGRGFLRKPVWAYRLDRLADALLGYVRPDGGVQFSHDDAGADTRCTLFALQALYLSARQGAREPAPTAAFQLLV
jgi:hypothetical protein